MIVPRYTREIPHRYRLEANKCTKCGFIAFPRRLVCPECGHEAKDPGSCPNCQVPLVATCPVCGNPLVGEHVHLEDQATKNSI